MKRDKTLVLRTVAAEGTSHGGFKWPKRGKVTAPDFEPTKECGAGLHGLAWGLGDWCLLSPDDDTRIWQIVSVDTAALIELGDKVKFESGYVVLSGTRGEALRYLDSHGSREHGFGVVFDGDVERIDAGVWVVCGGTINYVYGGTINSVYGGTINYVRGGTINSVYGGTINYVDGGTINSVYGGTINSVDGGTINYVRGGTINSVYGGTINSVDGGTINSVDGGTINYVRGGTINSVRGGTITVYGSQFSMTLPTIGSAVVIDRAYSALGIFTASTIPTGGLVG